MDGLVRKAGLGIVMAATALTAALPADAQRWRGDRGRWHHRDRGGDIATGALVGGVVGLGLGAAIASNNRRDRYWDRRYYGGPRGYYRNRYWGPPRGYWRDRRWGPPRGYYGRPYYGGGWGYGGGWNGGGWGYGW